MRSLRIAALLTLALVCGCSCAASISKGQESYLQQTLENDNMRRVFNSTVRIRAFNGGRMAWMGSGNVYKIEGNTLSIVSNNHVLNDAEQVTGEFFHDGNSLGQFVLDVGRCVEGDNLDIGLATCAIGTKLVDVESLPFSTSRVSVSDEIFWVGSSTGEWPNGQLGRVIYSGADLFYATPTAIGGDSGSSVVRFNEAGEPEIVGLIAWRGMHDRKEVAMAMHSDRVIEVIETGIFPKIRPNSPREEKLLKGILDRLRDMRQERDRDFKILRDRFSALELELAYERQETQFFRDRWKKGQQENDDRYNQIEEDNESLGNRIMGQFSTLQALIKLAKWSFYALVAALIASIFFGQGWLTRIIVTIVRVAYQVARTAVAIIADAISRPLKKTETPTESIENLREEIGTIDDPVS